MRRLGPRRTNILFATNAPIAACLGRLLHAEVIGFEVLLSVLLGALILHEPVGPTKIMATSYAAWYLPHPEGTGTLIATTPVIPAMGRFCYNINVNLFRICQRKMPPEVDMVKPFITIGMLPFLALILSACSVPRDADSVLAATQLYLEH